MRDAGSEVNVAGRYLYISSPLLQFSFRSPTVFYTIRFKLLMNSGRTLHLSCRLKGLQDIPVLLIFSTVKRNAVYERKDHKRMLVMSHTFCFTTCYQCNKEVRDPAGLFPAFLSPTGKLYLCFHLVSNYPLFLMRPSPEKQITRRSLLI